MPSVRVGLAADQAGRFAQAYNAHATAADALWVGLPVVTVMAKPLRPRRRKPAAGVRDARQTISRTMRRWLWRAIRRGWHR